MKVSRHLVRCCPLLVIALLSLPGNAASGQETEVKPAAQQPAAPPPRTLRVKLIGADDRALPGATVHVSVWTTEPFRNNRDYRSDDAGWATIELPHAFTILRLWGIHSRHVTMFANWNGPDRTTDVAAAVPKEYTFRLPKGQTLGGFVKNEAGEPIKGAQVQVSQSVPPHADSEGHAIPIIWFTGNDYPLTDAKGRWTLENVPPGEHVEVHVKLSHPDYVSDDTWDTHQRQQKVATKSFRERTGVIVMPRGARVRGLVLDPEQKPIAGAVVVWGDRPNFRPGSQVQTDEKGRFQFPPLAPGKTTFTAMVAGWAPDATTIELGKEDTELNFPLQRGKPLRIRFVDVAGKPIPEVFVTIDRWRNARGLYNQRNVNGLQSGIPSQADKEGLFTWTWAPDDPISFSFHKEGYHVAQNQILTAGEEVEVKLAGDGE